jgi:hypothetical protein
MAEIPFRIGLYEAKTVVPIDIFPAGTYEFWIGQPAGNSLLSTVFVQELDPGASVKINYFDSGPGGGQGPGERIDLEGHTLVTTAPKSERRIITRISNKPKIEIIVTGGEAVLGVHIAVVTDFPQEPALKDGDTADLGVNKGAPIMVLGSDNKWYAWRGDNGIGQVEIVGSVVANTDPFSSVVQTILPLPVANVAATFNAVAGTKAIWLKTANPNTELKIKWGSNTNSTTVYSGAEYSKMNLDPAINWQLEIQSNKANTSVEIETWG